MIRISPDSPLKSKIQDANKKMIRKMTALLKTKQWFKHPRLEQINTSVDACAILGFKYPRFIYINASVSACTIFKLNCSEL